MRAIPSSPSPEPPPSPPLSLPTPASPPQHLHAALLRQRTYSQLLRSQRKASEASLSALAAGAEAAASVAAAAAAAPELGGLDPRLREAAFVEAADCFAALVAKPEARQRLLKVGVGANLLWAVGWVLWAVCCGHAGRCKGRTGVGHG